MIMKRKLPSQMGKLEEELVKKPEAEEASTNKTDPVAAESPADASAPAPAPESAPEQTTADAPDAPVVEEQKPTLEAETLDESPPPSPTAEEEVKQAPAAAQAPPQEEAIDLSPADIPDPFVHDTADEDDMVMDAPPQRPADLNSDTEARASAPRKRSISTEALVEDTFQEPVVTPPAQEPPTEEPPKEAELDAFFSSDEEQNSEPEMEAKPTPKEDEDAWDLGDLVDIPEDQQKVGGSPFAEEATAGNQEPEAQTSGSGGEDEPTKPSVPPWKRRSKANGADGGKSAQSHVPSLPGSEKAAGSRMGVVVSLGLVALLIGGTALFYKNRDVAVEKISRWTGTLDEVGQPVPVPVAEKTEQMAFEAEQGGLEVESVVKVDASSGTGSVIVEQPEMVEKADPSSISLEVLDVAPEEANQPIVADDSVEIPEELDKFSALQEAIARKRSERREKDSAKLEGEPDDLDPGTLEPEEITKRNLEIIRQTNASLEEYRKALANVDDPALKPRPGKFLSDKRDERNGILPPPGREDSLAPEQEAQQPELYGNQVVSDLSELVTQKAQEDDGIRQLEDFDVSLFDPQRRRVSIPRGVSPRLSAEDFPALEVLSFVQGQGIIGKVNGKEGVLLLGETLEGWELVEVLSHYAEFQKDGKKRMITFKNANR